jgi:hypothetical protein
MKKLFVISILLSIFLVFGLELSAQERHLKQGKQAKKTVIVKKGKAQKFRRNRVVVVKNRNYVPLKMLPNGYTTLVYRKNNYYYHGGFFYRNFNNSYQIVAPPKGVRIKVLPIGYRRIIVAGKPQFYYRGIFYNQSGSEYETVEPVVGTIVPEIPQEVAAQITIDNEPYYEVANVLYKTIETEAGTQYQVAGQLEDETHE